MLPTTRRSMRLVVEELFALPKRRHGFGCFFVIFVGVRRLGVGETALPGVKTHHLLDAAAVGIDWTVGLFFYCLQPPLAIYFVFFSSSLHSKCVCFQLN